ncbi:MAG TPA: hypothetical protein VFR38_00350 [Gaiellaceae bacterium]|nr:hypothetical protein [Gaiellaceae bacterium]
MATPRIRTLAVAVSGAALLLALIVSASGTSSRTAAPAPATSARAIDSASDTTLRAERLARAAIAWRGGPITASTGETVNVLVSDALPVDTSTPEGWAEFLVGLTHGPEISLLTTHIAPLDEVQELCGSRALGCYARNQMISLGETIPSGTTAEEVVRHEYGHHVAMHRLNSPWTAIDWGPKHWASAADVCARVTRKEAFPGDQGSNYARNPGEAWAEVYRLMDERKAGIVTANWPIITPDFYPADTALLAAERDVLQPWRSGKTTVFTRVFGKATKKVWWIPLSTPLDGDLRISATLPKGADHEVALVGRDRRRVIRRAQWVGQRLKRMAGSVCGQRALFVRVTQAGALGRVRVSVATP